jgi:integral membrane protein
MSAPSPATPSPATPHPAPPHPASSAPGRVFRWFAIAEACSWAGLLVGMFFKYVVVGNDIGVTVFGPIHGALFVAYVVVSLVVARALRWDVRTLVLALVASVPPLCTLWFERWAVRTGRLAAPARPAT